MYIYVHIYIYEPQTYTSYTIYQPGTGVAATIFKKRVAGVISLSCITAIQFLVGNPRADWIGNTLDPLAVRLRIGSNQIRETYLCIHIDIHIRTLGV